MAGTPLMPDIEACVIRYLRADAAIKAIFGDSIYSILSSKQRPPTLRVTRLSSTPVVEHPYWLDSAQLQADIWIENKAAAYAAAATLANVLTESSVEYFPPEHGEVVISAVSIDGVFWQPDEIYTPPLARYVVRFTVVYHPLVVAG